MRVLVAIFEQLIPISGGGTPRIRSIIDILVKRGHEVSVAAPFDTDANEACEILNCHQIFSLKNVSRLDKNKMTKYMLFHPSNIFKVVDAATEIRPDILIAHNSIAGLAGLLAKKLTGCLAVIDVGDMLSEYLSFYSKRALSFRRFQRISTSMENGIIQHADKIITISDSMKETLVQRGAKQEKVNVVYDGVNIDLFTPKRDEAIELRKKHAAGAESVVMYHGAIDPQDHPEILADAAVSILETHPRTVFWLVGDGAAVNRIKEMVKRAGIEDQFFFSGWIPYEDVPSFISASDVGLVILPNKISSRVRVTLKTFEYWACEKPIVAAELPALKEIVTPCRNGLFYRSEDPADLAEKVCVLLDDRRLSREMGKAGRQLVEKKYNWSKLATQFVAICEDLYTYTHAHTHTMKN